MKMNKFKRIVATAMMTIMALGSSMTAFAEGDSTSANGATGTGKSTNHLDTDYVQWTLPTSSSVAETFNFWVDPEDILAKADKLPDGTEAKDYHNDDLVYFKVSENGAVSYNSTSNSVSMNIKNYVSANVTVKATLKNSTATRIPFAKDADELAANTTAEKASLLLKLNVGTSSNAIVDEGSSAEYEVAGQPDNFGVSLNSAANAETISYKLTPSENATWSSVSINLSGKASKGEVTDSLIAPQVELTWDIKSAAVPAKSSVPATTAVPETGDITVAVTVGADNKNLTKLEVSAYSGDMLTMGNGYGATYSNKTITLGADIATYLRSASASDLSGVTFTATFGTGDGAYTQTFKFTK
ncbi:MAG: hypothetical protein IKI75_05720 [Lachnospiraceae bacterium]|nr:hypothetical protein [Lachnospiraceae bacterium]